MQFLKLTQSASIQKTSAKLSFSKVCFKKVTKQARARLRSTECTKRLNFVLKITFALKKQSSLTYQKTQVEKFFWSINDNKFNNRNELMETFNFLK